MREMTVPYPRRFPRYARKNMVSEAPDLASNYPELLPEWDDEVDPASILPGSHKQIRWKCPRGHSYTAMPYARVRGTGCPYCANRKVLPGFNDLATLYPDVAAEWDRELNGDLAPSDVTRGSTKKIWWRCRFGHVWKAAVYSRTRERAAGCPYCGGPGKRRGQK